MSLLVPDYASSSDDEAAGEETVSVSVAAAAPAPPAPTAAPASLAQLLPPPASSTATTKRRRQPTKKQKQKKPKTALFLHPDIQRLLESGASRAPGDSSDSDDHDEDSLLAKQKRAIAAKRPRAAAPAASAASTGLSFLPPPKHAVDATDKEDETLPAPAQPHGLESHSHVDASGHVEPLEPAVAAPAALAQTPQPVTASYDVAVPSQMQMQQQQYYEHGYYDAAQYPYQYDQSQASYPVVYQGEDETFGSSKRARTRDRELERALQQGHFHSVASKIVEVHGPAPGAWAPPPASVGAASSSRDSGELKVKASFWDAQAGARVATVKPNRMQRQKHQLNQLAFDAKLREHELLDKKGASLKTKAETHAKYGW